jgi:Flp pilus assembly protein TadB
MFQIVPMFDTFAWILLLLCITIVFLQLTPWLLETNKALLDWWNFHLGNQEFAQAYASQSNVVIKFFANRFGRLLYLIGMITAVIGLLKTSVLFALLLGISGVSIPIIAQVRYRFKQRLAMEHALPDVMAKLAALISAGQPLHQAIVELPDRIDPVLSPHFLQIRSDLRMGISLSDSLKRQERRLDLEEFVVFASCLRVGLSSGGTLAPSIERLSSDMRKRLNLRSKLRVLTVQARGQAWIMSALPPLILAALSIVDPGGFEFLLHTAAGRSALSLAICMNLVGAWWVRRLSQSKWA